MCPYNCYRPKTCQEGKKYEAEDCRWDFVPLETSAKSGALFSESEADETGAEEAQGFKLAKGTRVLVEVAFLARESHLLALDGVVIIPRMTPAKASEGAGSNPPQAASINPAVDSAASTTTAGTTASQSAPPAARA